MLKKLRILTIVGARPQFIKAAMVSRAIMAHNESGRTPQVIEEIIHTGQHYDTDMSDIFFKEMGIPHPAVNLDINDVGHGEMTGRMLSELEKVFLFRKPDWVIVYGDTNSTLAAALASAKLHIPVAHVEAGLRSFNKKMPEEINRVLTDHISSLLFCPTLTAVENLEREGITNRELGIADTDVKSTFDSPRVFHIGDVMYDAALYFGSVSNMKRSITKSLGLNPKCYALFTCHRAENTDDPNRFVGILEALAEISNSTKVVFPIHPRTASKCKQVDHPVARYIISCLDRTNVGGEHNYPGLIVTNPVSFLDMVSLEQSANVIITDSGGIQKEAYFHGVPCVTMRDETEWVETIEAGWNNIAGTIPQHIVNAVKIASTGNPIRQYGDGHASESIISALM